MTQTKVMIILLFPKSAGDLYYLNRHVRKLEIKEYKKFHGIRGL